MPLFFHADIDTISLSKQPAVSARVVFNIASSGENIVNTDLVMKLCFGVMTNPDRGAVRLDNILRHILNDTSVARDVRLTFFAT